MVKKISSYTRASTRTVKTKNGPRKIRVKSHVNKINRKPKKR
jgi:hypothetical protein